MNTLLKALTGLLAATAAASSMAQIQSGGANCGSFSVGAVYTDCMIAPVEGFSDDSKARFQTNWLSTLGVTGSFYVDNIAIQNEADEAVLSLADITPGLDVRRTDYELTFKQAIAGPFALILGTLNAQGSTNLLATLYRFGNGVAAGDSVGITFVTANSRIPSLAYAAVVGVATPVPEPQAYALVLAGLGVVGWAARRRQNAAALAAA